MAKKEVKETYYKVGGKNIGIFHDPKTGMKVLPSKPGTHKGQKTARMDIALKNGHIKQIEKDEYDKLMKRFDQINKGETPPKGDVQNDESSDVILVKGFTKKEEALDYYQENYQIDEDEVDKFSKMKLKDQKEYLLGLLEDDEDED